MSQERSQLPAARWTRAPSVSAVELDGETVLYDLRGRRLHLLNASATVIWAALDGSRTSDDLVEELSEAFGIEVETMHDHVTWVLATLREEGLIEAASSPGGRAGRGTR
jgi:PqqD family protein of HPr-rel-A system